MADTQTVIQRLDPKTEARLYGLFDLAKSRTARAPKLPDYEFAGTLPQGRRALALAERGLGAYSPYLRTGANTLQSGANIAGGGLNYLQSGANIAGRGVDTLQTGANIAGGGLNTLNQASDLFRQNVGAPTQQQLNAYLNPYQDAIQGEINRSFDIQSSRAGLQAAGSPGGPSAYGGSRAAIQQAEIGRNRAQALAQSQAANFLQAQRGVQNQFGRGLQAAQGLGRLAGLQGQIGQGIGQLGGVQGQIGQGLGQLAGVQGQIGQGIGQIGTAQANLAGLGSGIQQQGIAQLAQLAEQQRLIEQGILDAERQTDLQKAYEPYQRLGFYSDILRGAPTSQQTITSSTSPKPGILNQLLGAGLGAASLYGASRQLGAFG